MRILKSTPKQRDFANEHLPSLTGYKLTANIGQILSGASMAVALYYIFKDLLASKGVSGGSWGIIAVALGVGLFIELANRFLIRPALRPLVAKDQFADDAEKQSRHKVLTNWPRLLLVLFGGLSLYLSYDGSLGFGDAITTKAATVNVDSLDNSRSVAVAKINESFAADTTVLLAPFALRTKAANAQFAAIEAERQKATGQFAGCAAQGNKWCKNNIASILGEIDGARATMNATLAAIAIEKSEVLRGAMSKRDALIEAANKKLDSKIVDTKSENEKEESEREKDATSNGYIFAILTLLGQLAFYVFTYLAMQIEEGSEIVTDVRPNEFYSKPSVLADLKAVIYHRTERGARRLIQKVFGHRDKLDSELPFVSIWSDPVTEKSTAQQLVTADGIDAELTQREPVATNHAPQFYQSGNDPYAANNSQALYSPRKNHEQVTETVQKVSSENLSDWQIKQRIKKYKKAVGTHTQKAKVQQRKEGVIKPRTAKAIANNENWVSYYTSLLNNETK